MKLSKKILSIFLALLMVVLSFSGCAQSLNSTQDGKLLTKGQWITLLSNYFGLDQCQSNSPYFTDVSTGDDIFIPLQSCYEWKILSNDGPFDENKVATKEFVVSTAVMAIGNEYTGLDLDSSKKDIINYALKNNIIASKAYLFLKTGITNDDAEALVKQTVVTYNSQEFPTYDNSTIKEDVKDYQKDTTVSYNSDSQVVSLQGDKTSEIKVGDVITLPADAANPAGNYRKVTGVTFDGEKTIITTEDPEIGDIYTNLDFSGSGTITSKDQIIPADGVTITDFNGGTSMSKDEDAKVSFLGNASDTPSVSNTSKGASLGLSVSVSSNGKVSVNKSINEHSEEVSKSPNVYDSNGKAYDSSELYNKTGKGNVSLKGDKVEVDSSDKYTGGWKITGSFNLSGLYFEQQFTAQKVAGIPVGIESLKLKTHCNVSSSLSLEGYLSEKVLLATVPIPIGPTGVSVAVSIYAQAGLNGKITLTFSTDSTVNVRYKSGAGFSKTQETTNKNDLSLSGDITVGVGISAALSAGSIKLFDLSADVGFGVSAKMSFTRLVKVQNGMYLMGGDEKKLEHYDFGILVCFDCQVYFPTLSVSSGYEASTLASKINLKFKVKIIDKKDAPIKSVIIPLHYEVGNGFVDKCTAENFKPFLSVDVSTVNPGETTTFSSGSNFLVSSYSLYLSDYEPTGTFSIVSLPKGYSYDDFVFTCKDDGVASITANSDGSCEVKAKGEGMTVVTVKSKDNKYSADCTIMVSGYEATSA